MRSQAIPASVVGTVSAPVENTSSKGSRISLPNRSRTTGKSVTRYTRSGRKPPTNSTVKLRELCPINTSPVLGEMITASSSVPLPARSLIRSSNSKRINPSNVSTNSNVSGTVWTTTGGLRSSGPPGGAPCCAQALARLIASAADTSPAR